VRAWSPWCTTRSTSDLDGLVDALGVARGVATGKAFDRRKAEELFPARR
jgi:hypothetical protein